MTQPQGPAASPDTTEVAPPPLPPRRYRGWGALGLLGCIGLLLWCSHWLSSAQLSAPAGAPTEADRYTVALLLAAPALAGLFFSLSELLGGRWLRWLALFLTIAEAALLVGTGAVLHYLEAATPMRLALLAGGLLGCLALGYLLARRLRR